MVEVEAGGRRHARTRRQGTFGVGTGRPRWKALATCWLALSCRGGAAPAEPPALRLATSYSLEDSGLFAALAPRFTRQTEQRLEPHFVGTGEALNMGRTGEADVVWVHSRVAEDAFIAEGYGLNRRDVMYSEYAIVGPPSDPAKLDGQSAAVEALSQLVRAGGRFVSRGDKSGNRTRELRLWKLAGIEPEGTWYTSLGAGMLPTLIHASEQRAYALTDLPTYLVNKDRLDLKVLVRGDARLRNQYAVIAVNPTRVSGTRFAGAMAFIDFITSPETQAFIADFGRAEYGAPLFTPLAVTEGRE